MSRQPSPTFQVLRQNRLWISRFLAVFMALWQIGQPLQAATFYWDTDSSDTGNLIDGANLGGIGSWDTAISNWWPVPAGALTTWGNTSSDVAIFSGPTGSIPTLNTVTLSSGITANQLRFNRSGYTFTGGDLTLAGTTPTLGANLGESATIASQISGTAGLLKSGGGSIRLGNASNNYTGTTTIANGSLIISNPAALGGTGTVSILTTNNTPLSTAFLGFGGGSLVLDGTAGGFTFARDVDFEGRGPIGERGSAILSLGNNTLSGTLQSAISPLPLSPTATIRNSRINSVNGTLTLSGSVAAGGTAATTFLNLGGVNSAGTGNFDLTGVLSGTGSIEKSGGGTLFLNPSSTSGFAGTFRISGSATGQQSSVRVTQESVGGTSIFGTRTATGAGSVLDMSGGVLEIRSDTSLNFDKRVYQRNGTTTLFTGPAAGGSAINGTSTFGILHVASNTGFTFESWNGFGVTFTGNTTQENSNNNVTWTNNMGGTLLFTGNVWPNSEASVLRTLAINSTGNTTIAGSIVSTGAGVKTLAKSGAGNLTIQGVATSLNGPVTVSAGAITVTDFRSLNNNTASISLGNASTTAGNLIIGGVGTPTLAGLTTSKTITLSTTTVSPSIYANQSGSNPVVLNGAITRTTQTTGGLILGGSNTADNIINVAIPVGGTTGGLTKLGAGTWVLNAANAYPGATTIQNGTLKLRATAAASDVIPSAAANTVVFSADAVTQSAGGTLEFRGFLNTATTETLGALTPTAGAAKIVTVANGSGTAALTFSSLGTRGAGAYVDYRPGASTTLSFTTLPTVTNGILGAASVSAFQTFNGVNWATLSGSNVVAFAGYTVDTLPASGVAGAAVNYSQSINAATTGTASINTLKLIGGGANPTVTLGGVLTLTGRAILFDNTSGTGTITGSQLGASATEVHVITNGSSAANGGVSGVALTLGNALTIDSLIGGTTGSFTKSGNGTLIVSGNNTFTSNAIINEGIVQLSGSTATLGVNSTAANLTTVRQGATLDINAAGVSQTINVGALVGSGVITNSGGGVGTAGTIAFGRSTSTGTTIFSGVLQDGVGAGGGVLNVTVDGTTARTQALIGNNTYTGVTTIATGAQLTVDVLANGGPGNASGIGSSTNAAGNLVFNGAAPQLIYRGNIRNGSLNLGSASATTDRLFTISGAGAILSSTATLNNAIVWSNTGAIVHGGADASRLMTLTGTSTGDNTFNPQLTDDNVGGGFITSLSKTAAGQWNLGNSNNTYTGITTLNEGILALNNNGALPTNSPLLLAPTSATSAAIFQMSGTLDRNLAATATAGAGTITFGGTTASTTGGVGFAAHSTELIVAIGGVGTPTALTWGTGGFVGTGAVQNLVLNSTTALSSVDFRNAIALGASARTISVLDNTNTGADFATMSGVLSGAGGGVIKIGAGNLRLTGANSYTGTTAVEAGTLVVSSLGSSTGGATSSVGAGGVAMDNSNAIVLGNASTTGGLLQYVGAGETSDRKIRLRGTTAGNQIHADGSGPLILTNVAHDTTETGAKTLSLRGSSAAGNMITSALTDNGVGVLSVTVEGGATWILTGANTFTGTLTASAGALGIGSAAAVGGAGIGTIVNNNGNIFAYGADRTITRALQLTANATNGWLGDYSLAFNGTNSMSGTDANLTVNTNNSIAAGKTLTFNGMTSAATAARTWNFDGSGETVITGNYTTSSAFGVNIVKTGNGTLTLGTNGATSDWNKAGNALDLDRGTLQFTADNAIPNTATSTGLTISPETATGDTATLNLNGTTQTINALTATTDGAVIIDNTSGSAATFRFGANDTAVTINPLTTGARTITDSGAGALSLVKLGTTTTTFNPGMTLTYQGTTAAEAGVFTINSDLAGSTGLLASGASTLTLNGALTTASGNISLSATGNSTLALTGGISSPNLINSITVGAGSTLSLLDGAGSLISNLTTLNLGNTGTGTATLNLNIGDSATDTLTLLTAGTVNLGNTITFNMTDVGLSPLTTYTLLNLTDGGLNLFGFGNVIQGATPGGFSGFTWSVTDTLVQITTGTLITGQSFWRGATDGTWNGNVNNWSTDKAGAVPAISTPGQGTDVVFAYDGVGAGPLTTTLEQNFKVNSLTFEAGTTTPTAVTIAPGAVATNRLEVAPQLATDGVTMTATGPAAVTISAPFRLGADQDWQVDGAAQTLTLSGALLSAADVTKSGAGWVVLGAAADASFNTGLTADFTVNAGNLELTNAGALGTVANANLARVAVNGGGFYYNNAVSGTVVNPLTLAGGALSVGGANQTYSGTLAVNSASTINMADSNGPVTNTARNITLSGVVSGNGSLTIDSNNGTASVTNLIQQNGTLTMNNAGNTWSGDLIFNRGSVTLAAAVSPSFTGNNVAINSFGRLLIQGVNAQTLTRTGTLSYGAGAIGEMSVDNTSGALGANFLIQQDGAVSLGSAGTGASVRVFLADTASAMNIGGAVTLGGNSSISVAGGDADSFLTISGVIGDGGSGYGLAINDDAQGWGQTNTIVRLTGANTFSGNVTLDAGVLEFDTVSNVGGVASSLGQGTAIATTNASTLRFIGSSAQSTNRPITTAGGALTLSANGVTAADTITYAGAITVGPVTDGTQTFLTGAAGRVGIIAGGLTQTGDVADMTVNGGTWTFQTGTSRIGDDVTLTGATTIMNLTSGLTQVRDDFTVTTGAILNLNGVGALSFNIGTLSGDASLRAFTGGIINLGANQAVVNTEFDGLRLGTDAAGVGTLNLGTFSQTVNEFLLGNRNIDRSGVVTGSTGVLTATGNVDLYGGTISGNLGSTGAGTLDKLSLNTVTLSGDNSALAATGATVITEGTLVLDYTNNTATKVRAASALDMRGANLTLIGNATTAVAQSVGSFTLGTGGNNIINTTLAGQDVVLNLGAITRAANAQDGAVRFNLPAGTPSATLGYTTTSLNTIGTGTSAILGAWATVTDATGTYFARNLTNVAGGNIGIADTTLQNTVGSWVNGQNISDTVSGFSGTVSTSNLNSLRFNQAGGSDLAVAQGGVLSLNSGGILVTSNVGGTPSLLGGTLGSSYGGATPEIVVVQDSAASFEIGSDIRSGHILIKSGTGTLLLSGQNTYTGLTEILDGTLALSGGNAIGDSSLVSLSATRDSTLQLLASETIGRLNGGSRNQDQELGTVAIGVHTLTVNQSATQTYAGRITGTGSLVMNSGNTGNLNLSNISTGFTGSVVVNGGLLNLTNLGQINASSITINRTGGLLFDNNGTTRSGTRILDTTAITLNSADGAFSGQTVPRGLSIRTEQNANTNETIGDLNFNSGASYLSGEGDVGTGTASSFIIANNFTRANSATLMARGRALGDAAGERNQFRIGTAGNETAFIGTMVGGLGAAGTQNISIVPWAIGAVNSGTNGAVTDNDMGNSFLTYTAGTGLRPLAFATEYDTIALAVATDNARESLGADLTGLAGTTVNSLVINNTAFAGLDVTGSGAGQTLAVTSGAMLFTVSGGVASTAYDTTLGGFNNGITVGGTNEYLISVVNPSSAANTSTLTATLASPLTSNADITKSGRGTLVLNQVNTAGGGANKTTINEGTIQIADLDNIGGSTGGLVFAGGALRLGTGFTDDLSTRTISFLLGGGTLDTNGNDAALASSLGSGAGAFTKIGAGNLTLNATSTWTGATTLTTGTITIGATNALGVGGNLTIGAGATLALGTNSISAGLVTTGGASPLITGTGTVTAATGFVLNHTGDTAIGAVLAGAGGLLKAQTNVVTLSGLNTYTGTTEIQAGTISFDTIGNVGGGASALGAPATVENGIIRTGLTTVGATLTYTGAGSTSDRIIEMQGTTGGLTINANGTGALAFGRFQTVVNGAKTLTLRGSSAAILENSSGQIQEAGAVLSVIKADANTWAYAQSQSYTGATTVDDGILRLKAAQSLTGALQYGSANTITTTGTVEVKEDAAFGSLLVQPNGSASLVVDPTKEVTINGNVTIGSAAASSVTNFAATGGGDFTVNNLTNTGNTFLVGGTGTANTTLADFSALSTMNVALNTTSGVLLVSSNSGTNATGKAELRLADTSVVSGSAITVGGGGTFNGNVDQVNLLKLGSVSNTLNVNTVNIGTGARDLGSITFLDSSGSVTVRAADGSSAAAFNMGTGTATTSVALAGNQNSFDVTGHNADLKFSTVSIGTQNRNADLVNVFSFDTGTLDMTSLNASSKGANGFTTTTNINLGGGTVTSGAWTLASNTGPGTAVANANITGGVVTLLGNISRGVNTGAGTATATVSLAGGTLNMGGNSIGSLNAPVTFVAQSGSVSGLAELNGGGALTKTTSGILIMGAANAYNGATTVSDGTLQVGVAGVGTTGTGLITAVKVGATYANAAVISGSGNLSGAVVIGDMVTAADRGILAPGDGNTANSNATVTITAAGGLTIAAGSQTQLGITAASGTDTAFAASGLSASAYLAGLGSTSDGSAGAAPAAWFSQPTSGQGDFIKLSNGTGALVLGTNGGAATAGQGIVSIFSNGLNTGALAAGQIFNLVDWFGAFSGGFSTGIGASAGGVHGDFDLPDISTTTFGWDTSAFTSHGVIAVVVVPEPSRALLMLIGLLALGFRRRRIQD